MFFFLHLFLCLFISSNFFFFFLWSSSSSSFSCMWDITVYIYLCELLTKDKYVYSIWFTFVKLKNALKYPYVQSIFTLVSNFLICHSCLVKYSTVIWKLLFHSVVRWNVNLLFDSVRQFFLVNLNNICRSASSSWSCVKPWGTWNICWYFWISANTSVNITNQCVLHFLAWLVCVWTPCSENGEASIQIQTQI